MINRSYERYNCPGDKEVVQKRILEIVASAKREIRVYAYGFTWDALTTALIAAHQRGVDVEALFDLTQACGPSERAQLIMLDAAGVDFQVGTSLDPGHTGAIRHSKVLIIDQEIIEDGSLNYSEIGLSQNNTVQIQRDREIAAFMLADWNESKADILAKCPQDKARALAAGHATRAKAHAASIGETVPEASDPDSDPLSCEGCDKKT